MVCRRIATLIALAAFVAVVTAGCVSLINVVVPDVVGMTQADALAALEGAGLAVATVTYGPDPTIPLGDVISQDVAAGTTVVSGSVVNVTVSTGPERTVTVPYLGGMSQAAAQASLFPLGLIVGAVSQQYSSTVPVGEVVDQDPAPGASVKSNTTVNLVLSKGPAPVTVPNVVDESQTDAQAAITAAGLLVGTVTEQYSATVPTGGVSGQNPAAGASVPPGSLVSLILSEGNTTTITVKSVSFELVLLPAGTFTMGSPNTDPDAAFIEFPQHPVTLLQDFWVCKDVVTKRLWQAALATTPWAGQGNEIDDPDSPAVYVSWTDVNNAGGFISALNGLTGLAFRLPTEAEWECACRAGTTTRYYWGDDLDYTLIGAYAWYAGNAGSAGQSYATGIGQKTPNPWGLYDMSGNVWEWCSDWLDSYPMGIVVDPTGAAAGTYKMMRGGSWNDSAAHCRSASRGDRTADTRDATIGFRLAMTGP